MTVELVEGGARCSGDATVAAPVTSGVGQQGGVQPQWHQQWHQQQCAARQAPDQGGQRRPRRVVTTHSRLTGPKRAVHAF